MKEGHEVTLNQGMEIARLEVSMQHHLERIGKKLQKVNYGPVWKVYKIQIQQKEATI